MLSVAEIVLFFSVSHLGGKKLSHYCQWSTKEDDEDVDVMSMENVFELSVGFLLLVIPSI